MLKSPLLFAIGVLVSLLSWTASASADSLALSFALPPTSHTIAAKEIEPAPENKAAVETALITAIPMAASTQPPIEASSIETPFIETTDRHTAQPVDIPSNTVEKSPAQSPLPEQTQPKDNIGLHFAATALALPLEQSPVATSNEHTQLISSSPTSNSPTSNVPTSNSSTSNTQIAEHGEATALAFAPATVAYDSLGLDDWIFEGGSHSLVAHTVGSAEGTRHWNGKRTSAYYGHTDPGNGVWNLGTFSYQHDARTPEEADKKQLLRLKNQGLQLEQQATTIGISLSLEEKLNGLDLANQAPLAALGQGGYIERLDQAYRMQMTGFEAIAWARTRAYIDPETQTWNAPGLGNNLRSISQDQERRMAAINKALRAYNRDDTTVRALAKLDSISLESPAAESDELSRWDIHLTTQASPTPEEEEEVAATAKAPSKDTLSLTASLSTLNFGLPPSESPSTVAMAAPTELAASPERPEPQADQPPKTEPLETHQPSLERLLTSANRPLQPVPELQFETTEEMTLPNEEESPVPVDEDLALIATGTSTTETSTTETSIKFEQDVAASGNAAPAPSELSEGLEDLKGLEDLRRFEDPNSLGPVAAQPSQPANHEAATYTAIETAEALSLSLEKDQDNGEEDNQASSPNTRSRWRIHIEDRVINRK